MAKVSNLNIALQTGTENKYFASWSFTETTSAASSSVKVGSWVTIKSGAKYYNGVTPPNWVLTDTWKVGSITDNGKRVVLRENTSGTHDIKRPFNIKDLIVAGAPSTNASSKNLDKYSVKWYYSTGDSVWFKGNTEDTQEKNSVYDPPSNARVIKVSVKPVSKTDSKGTSYFTGEWVTVTKTIGSVNKPEKMSAPKVELDKFKLTASVENIEDEKVDQVQFQIVNNTKEFAKSTATVTTCRAKYSKTINSGGVYKVRCRGINNCSGTNVYGDWSPYSEEVKPIPKEVSGLTCKATSDIGVKLTWNEVPTATSYEIQYSLKKTYFDTSSEVQSTTVENVTTAYINGLRSGEEWFFRVRAVNETGPSGWGTIRSKIIGTKPEAPTTWSSTNTATVGEDIVLYWVHNCEDGSYQTKAQIEYTGTDGKQKTVTVTDTTPEDADREKTYSYKLDTSKYSVGKEIEWRVRTAGITGSYGPYSTARTIDVYAPPVLTLDFNDTLDEDNVMYTFPLKINIDAQPTTQKPTSYHVSIVPMQSHTVIDAYGNEKLVSKGSELFSKVYVTSKNNYDVEITAKDVSLVDGFEYRLMVTASMDSGLVAKEKVIFKPHWSDTDMEYFIEARIGIDRNTFEANIEPYCYLMDENGYRYYDDNIRLSVYRYEYDGSFTEISTDIENSEEGNYMIVDPHPSLDYARYRVVAKFEDTGVTHYEDIPAVPVNEKAIIIQWDEEWTPFSYTDEAEPELPPWSGSLLRLPYNVDVGEQKNNDVSLVGYIGRSHPVSYYGTQKGESGTWSTVITKTDVETLYALRKLAAWQGDVYVREPTGVGYYATIKVSISINHQSLTIPVSLNVTRVEGGM